MQTSKSLEMNGNLDHIVQMASDIEQWPVILPHYRWVTLLEGGGDYKFVEMAARRGLIPVKWRAVQVIDRERTIPVIHYRHIWGPTSGMVVSWRFEPQPNAIEVAIDHDFDPPWPLVGNFVADRIIGPQFVDAIAGQTLTTIKAIAENADSRSRP